MRNKERYAVIVTYVGGETTGAVVEANGLTAAWKETFRLFNPPTVAAVKIAQILTEERGGTK